MTRRTIWPAALAVIVLGSAGCATTSDPAPPAGPRLIEAHAYRVPSDPDSAIRFHGNRYVFEATVTASHANVRFTDGPIEAVYTPVTVVVDRSHRGKLAVGAEVTLRSMGGTADGVRYRSDDAPDKAAFAPGSRLLVFGGRQARLAGEPGAAITPNFVYRQVGDQFVDASYVGEDADEVAPARAAVADLRRRLQQ